MRAQPDWLGFFTRPWESAIHRLFAALPVPDTIAERLQALRTEMTGARWHWREHYHITLHFYGDVSAEIAEELANDLDDVRGPALDLSLSGVGWFGRREPRAVYARIAENEGLSRLAATCRKLARRYNLHLSKNPFRPHITLAYCKLTPLPEVMAWSEAYQTLRSEPFLIDQFSLYESFTRHRQRSTYVAQADYALAG
ncbi:MAG: RNA 2',3'-cyclic phosphodiesterase [Pseudomonadota bacterium]